ncbi:MAG: rRNA pseudouridine synthase [Myxococcales bacterium]|nr:rRNA pseudouridine synthase [Myxococcales bacterium]
MANQSNNKKPSGRRSGSSQAKKSTKKPADGERLQKVLSRRGVASRRGSEQLIADGRVTVNGVVVTEMGVRVNAATDDIRVDDERIKSPPRTVVLVLNKPVGTLCSENDPERRPLVHHLVPREMALRTVGRLDFNTEGVLLFTNDGDLALRLSHPRHGVQRTYDARVRGIPNEETLNRLVRGVQLDDGPAHVESVQVVKRTDRNAWVRLTLTEGRNREVRRLMERVGHPVMRLRRIRFAGVAAEGLKPGQWRELIPEEVEQLRERGHLGGFQLPPDPRRRNARVGGAKVEMDDEGQRQVRASLKSEAPKPRRRHDKRRG